MRQSIQEGTSCSFRGLQSISALLIFCAACARVEPGVDFNQASQELAARVAIPEAYDPAIESLIDTKVAALLQGGITMDEAVQIALLNNRGFQSLFQRIGASRADVVQSGLMTNPVLGLNVLFPEGGGRSKITGGMVQQLVDLWQIPVRKRITEAQLEQTVLAVLQRGVELTSEVQTAYQRSIGFCRTQEIAAENVQLAERTQHIVQTRLDSGDAVPLDLGLAKSVLFDAENALIAAKRDCANAQIELSRLLALDRTTTTLELTEPQFDSPYSTMDAGELVSLAISQRYDVKLVDARVEAAEAQLEREFLEVFPNIAMGLGMERTARRALPGRDVAADTARTSVGAGQLTAPTIQSKGERNLIRSQIIDFLMGPSFEITIPIWDQNQAQIAKVRYEVLELQKARDDLLDEIARQVRQAENTCRAAWEQCVLVRDKTLPQARENMELSRRRYEDGEESVLFLLDAEVSEIAARQLFVTTLQDYGIARAELQRVMGGSLTATASTQPAIQDPMNEGEKLE